MITRSLLLIAPFAFWSPASAQDVVHTHYLVQPQPIATNESDEIMLVADRGQVQFQRRDLRFDAWMNGVMDKGLQSVGIPTESKAPEVPKQYKYKRGQGWVIANPNAQQQMNSYQSEVNRKLGLPSTNAKNNAAPVQSSHNPKTANYKLVVAPPDMVAKHAIGDLQKQNYETVAKNVPRDFLLKQSLAGLLTKPESLQKIMDNHHHYQLLEAGPAMAIDVHFKTLFESIDPASIHYLNANRTGDGNVISTFSYVHLNQRATGTIRMKPLVIQTGGQAVWRIIDVSLPSKHLSLHDLVQYRIIEQLPQLPEFAAHVPEGRLSQAGEVTKVLHLESCDTTTFLDVWDTLNDETKQWPLAQFLWMRSELSQDHGSQSLVAQDLVGDQNSHGLRSDSFKWLQVANSGKVTLR